MFGKLAMYRLAYTPFRGFINWRATSSRSKSFNAMCNVVVQIDVARST